MQYYNKTQIEEQAIVIGNTIRDVKTDLTTYVDSVKITSGERSKLALLESSKFLGTFLTPGAIPTTGAVSGSYADVDSGIGEVVRRWIYDADTATFVAADAEVAGETSASIKQKYEDNANTNAFTDLHKTTVEALVGVTPATDYASFILAFDTAVSGGAA